ncbi:MAG: paraquat-inducible protein A [Pseudomonadota bacterium]
MCCLLVTAAGVIKYSIESAKLSDQAAQRLDISSSTELAWKSFLEKLSFNLYQGAEDEKRSLAVYYAEAERRHQRAQYFALGFASLASAYLVFVYLIKRQVSADEVGKELAKDCIIISLLAFLVGIVAPIMALRAYSELPVLGSVVLKYEAKSIVTALWTLFSNGNWLVAILISLFSIIVPILKSSISWISLQSFRPEWARRGMRIVKAIGKWSMADVFVISIFIAYFAIGSDRFSDASVGLGLYFFTAYCLLSQITSHYLLKAED